MAEPNDTPTRWREDDPAASSAARRSRRLAASALAIVALALVGAVVLFLSWLRPLPHAQTVTLRAVGLDREGLDRETAALATHPPAGALVVRVTGQADVRGREVRLLPADAADAGPSLRDLLRSLAANPSRHKLLVLDLAPVPPAVRRGRIGADVYAAVSADLEAVPDPARLTLCAASPGEAPVGADDGGASPFASYVDRGLLGAADGTADGARDRQVTARELAAYVGARVARRAWRCRDARQTPRMYGPPGDFAVAAASGGASDDAPDRPTKYPAWLLDGWKFRQQAWDGDDFRADPAAYQLAEALLLRAEREWLRGADEGQTAKDFKADLDRLKKRLTPPPPVDLGSLGAFVAQGRIPDPKTELSLRAPLDPDRLTPPGSAPNAPVSVSAETLAALKDKDPFDVASAVLDAATEDAAPRAERLRALDAFLRTQQPEPLYAETTLLRRLADLAARVPVGDWPAAAAGRTLETARQGERVAGDPADAAGVGRRIEAAAQRRYEGETLLLACHGYAPAADAESELEAAAAAYDAARRSLDVRHRGRKTLDRALAFLSDYAPYLEWAGAPGREWNEAVEAACVLADRIDAPEPPDAAAAVRHNDELAQATDDVEVRLGRLSLPFGPGPAARLRERLRRPAAQASLLAEADALLATPLPAADDRAALWEAARALDLRLSEETTRLDRDDDARHEAVAAEAVPPAPQDSAWEKRALQRASNSLALLRLAGVGAPDLKPIQDSLSHGGPAEAAAAPLAGAWADAEARCVAPAVDPAARDRLSQVCLPADLEEAVAGPITSARAELRARDVREARAWRAGRARYESRDLAALGALPDWLAHFYRDATRAAPPAGPDDAVELHAVPATLQFGPKDVSTAAAVEVRGAGPGVDVMLRFRTFSDWFTLTPPAASLPPGPAVSVPLRVSLRPEPERVGPAPAGFVAEAGVGGREYHRLVPVSLRAVTDRLDVFLSADPTGAAPLDELRLRPFKGRQLYYLFVRNPSARPRNLTVQLSDGNDPIPGGTAKIALKEHETLPVHFTPEAAVPAPAVAVVVPPPAPAVAAPAPAVAAPAPELELPDLKGPLNVRVLDADMGGAVAAEKAIPVEVALASEYAQVTGVRFTPPSAAGGGNRLAVTLRAAPGLTGPPVPVDLVLPGTGPDGRRKAKKGTFEGELPADGGELTLFAEDIETAPAGDDAGLIFLSVDGRARAYVFDADFAAAGDAVTPRAERVPALRLRAPSAAPSGPQFRAGVEVDNAPPGATLEVSLGRLQNGRFDADLTKHYPAVQRVHVGLRPDGPGGALAFEAAVADWEPVFDAGRIVGRRDLRARLFDRDGVELRTAFRTVTLDDAPPDGVRFVDAPRRARKDGPLTLTATGRSVSGVARANFFLGRPVAGKAPPDAAAVPGHATDPDHTLWTAVLPLKADKAGPADVSVEFVNGAGLSSFASTTVLLTDGPPDQNDPGSITGTVYEGSIPQPNLEVVLKDDKGAEKGRAKTKDDGKFAFERVPPGAYSLTVSKSATMREGTGHVDVVPNKAATAEIKLLMK